MAGESNRMKPLRKWSTGGRQAQGPYDRPHAYEYGLRAGRRKEGLANTDRSTSVRYGSYGGSHPVDGPLLHERKKLKRMLPSIYGDIGQEEAAKRKERVGWGSRCDICGNVPNKPRSTREGLIEDGLGWVCVAQKACNLRAKDNFRIALEAEREGSGVWESELGEGEDPLGGSR